MGGTGRKFLKPSAWRVRCETNPVGLLMLGNLILQSTYTEKLNIYIKFNMIY